MALGKNLKKKKLIPDEQEKKTVAKASKVKRKKLIPTDKTEKKTRAPKNRKRDEQIVNFITQEKQTRRATLRKKYENEIEQLSGQLIQFVVFRLGKEEYAVDIDQVSKVVVAPQISKIPKTSPYIKGFADVRGETVLAMDLAMKFGISGEEEYQYMLVINARPNSIGILLDELPLAQKVDGNNISSSMSLLDDTTKDDMYIKGLMKLESRMIYYLDVQELISSEKVIVVPEDLKK